MLFYTINNMLRLAQKFFIQFKWAKYSDFSTLAPFIIFLNRSGLSFPLMFHSQECLIILSSDKDTAFSSLKFLLLITRFQGHVRFAHRFLCLLCKCRKCRFVDEIVCLPHCAIFLFFFKMFLFILGRHYIHIYYKGFKLYVNYNYLKNLKFGDKFIHGQFRFICKINKSNYIVKSISGMWGLVSTHYQKNDCKKKVFS